MASRKILMYSFKGGAGRTVTTANVAFILGQEMHRRVVCIDLDIESAGSSVLFGLADDVREGRLWTVQDVLRGYFEPPTLDRPGDMGRESISLGRADFEEAIWSKLRRRVCESPVGGYVDFVPARTILRSTEERKASSEAGQAQFERLLQKIDGLSVPPEIMLFDSASGLQDTAMVGLLHSHVLVIFVRWSRQFVYGTMHFLRDYLCSRKFCPRISRIFLVPTAVPMTAPEGKLGKAVEERRERLAKGVGLVNDDAVREFGAPREWVKILDPIYECAGLKWDDRIFLMEEALGSDAETEKALADYRTLAATLASAVAT